MKRWVLVIALLLSVGVNIGILSTLALRGRPGPAVNPAPPPPEELPEELPEEGPAAMPPMVFRLINDLGLVGETREAFLEIQRTFFDATVAARAQILRLQAELRAQLTSEKPDRARIDELLRQSAEAHAALERALVDNLLASRELLDGEQEERFMHFMGRLRQHRGEIGRQLRDEWRRGEGPWRDGAQGPLLRRPGGRFRSRPQEPGPPPPDDEPRPDG